MTANTPPTPPAARDRKLDTVCFEAWTSSSLTFPAEGIEGVEEDDEDEDIAVAEHIRRIEQSNNCKEWGTRCHIDSRGG